MKIGEFSKKFNLTTDTVRYYINLGLIFPKKDGKQNIFDLENEKELKNIMKLKNICFSLEEIKEIIYFKKFIKNPTKKDSLRYKNIIKTKINEVNQKAEELKKATKLLYNELDESTSHSNYSKRGGPIEGLNLLQCPKCHSRLNLSATHIENSEILEGFLLCRCKKQYLIRDGVILDNDFINWEEEYIVKNFNKNIYINTTPTKHLEFVLKTKSIIDTILTKKILKGKSVFNLKCGGLDFFSSLLNNIDDHEVHFFMDTPIDYPYFKDLKNEYDKMNLDKKIIFFIGDYSELPLKYKQFDFLVDLFATSNYRNYIYPFVDKFLKKSSHLIGLFTTSEYLLNKFYVYDSNKIKNSIKNLSYKIIFDYISEFHSDGGTHSSFFSQINKARLLIIKAEKDKNRS